MLPQYSRLILLEYCEVNYFGGASVPYALLRMYKMNIKKIVLTGLILAVFFSLFAKVEAQNDNQNPTPKKEKLMNF